MRREPRRPDLDSHRQPGSPATGGQNADLDDHSLSDPDYQPDRCHHDVGENLPGAGEKQLARPFADRPDCQFDLSALPGFFRINTISACASGPWPATPTPG